MNEEKGDLGDEDVEADTAAHVRLPGLCLISWSFVPVPKACSSPVALVLLNYN